MGMPCSCRPMIRAANRCSRATATRKGSLTLTQRYDTGGDGAHLQGAVAGSPRVGSGGSTPVSIGVHDDLAS